ncbi:MAG TPA: M4 family metallopeptidase [Candidatus Hydrogenedentes bacterium]|nr:M4 family metallopeptidase [Candidatus Hydrogenedentota bacterium]HPG68515.1 M4 family metallopeptidase [Candidatus Hydrogenedentota bacterium]
MRAQVILPWVVLCLCLLPLASFGAPEADHEDLNKVLKTLHAPAAQEAPRLLTTDEGFLRYLGAPPGGEFDVPREPGKALDPVQRSNQFLVDHGRAFGILSACVDFRLDRVTAGTSQSYVRLQQTYDGVDVFAGQVVVQVDGSGGINSVLSDILRDTEAFDDGAIDTLPEVSAKDARTLAGKAVANESPSHGIGDLKVIAGPTLVIYSPAVLGLDGDAALAWYVTVASLYDAQLCKDVFVDAHSGEVLLQFNTIPEARYREVYDAANMYDTAGDLARKEGDPPSAVVDVNDAYNHLGDTYDFYYEQHARDSIDGLGMTLTAIVRVCSIYYGCPMQNAFWDPQAKLMAFGEGFASADDVVGHELTHGVTRNESNLIYMGESGAINETFSDVWGEFVDLTNGRGNDTEEVRWLVGEDLPESIGVIRNMADPPEYGLPDRMGSPYWRPTDWIWDDQGGVHTNCGVGSKLCYLLTDGDDFNGYRIDPLAEESDASIARVADLFYELQTKLLTPASDYNDMYMQLAQATINQGYTFDERLNVRAAGLAVEIAPLGSGRELDRFRVMPAYDRAANPVVVLTWGNPKTTDFIGVTVVRNLYRFPLDQGDGVVVYSGKAEKALDRDVVKNTEYYYAIFADFKKDFPQVLYGRATAGTEPPNMLSEAFDMNLAGEVGLKIDLDEFIDLQFQQLLFTPVGPPESALGGDEGYADYFNYEATNTPGVVELPVPRHDSQGTAYGIPLNDDSFIAFRLDDPFPFFGKEYYTLYLAANGYIALEPPSYDENFPSLAAHFASPRISFLFGDLSPQSGGEVWVRDLPDRVVVTFDGILEYNESMFLPPASWRSTVQTELFYNGQIRITYLQVYNVGSIVCGISDGRGVPIDPSELFPDLVEVDYTTDLSDLPNDRTLLSIDPVAPQWVLAGQPVSFAVTTHSPAGVPRLLAQWDGPLAVPPFADKGDGTGVFYWRTVLGQEGIYTLRVTAALGEEGAYQDVRIHVGDPSPKPEARDLRLRSANPTEDPTEDRPVDGQSPLMAEYTYYHPLADKDPDLYGESIPLLYWVRNGGAVAALDNAWQVPPKFTRAGDKWFFVVTPMTKQGVRGEPARSCTVTVVSMPTITSATPATGPSTGATTVLLTGTRLSNPKKVTFGSIPVQNIRCLGDTQLEVVSPAHAPGVVDILVTTAEGTGYLLGGYAFVDLGATIVKADVNRDGRTDALDVQLVVNVVLDRVGAKAGVDADANRDGAVNAGDIQAVVNVVLSK